jgi:hypothetical protein
LRPALGKIIDAVSTEVNKIIRPYGDSLGCGDVAMFDTDKVPADDELFAPLEPLQ